jgi:hypothetical protein
MPGALAPRRLALPAAACLPMLPVMFVVTEEAAAAIRSAYEQGGELSVAIEVRRLFPGVTDNARRGNAPEPSPAGNRCPRRLVRSPGCRPRRGRPTKP